MSTAAEVDPQGLLGRSREHEELGDYDSPEGYSELGDIRVVKDLMFTYHQAAPSPMLMGQDIVVEKVARAGDIVHVDELGKQALAKGERLGSFYTVAELRTLTPARQRQLWLHGQVPEEISEHVGGAPQLQLGDGGGDGEDNAAFGEMGEHELAEYISEKKPNVNETVAMADGDPDTARRVLAAENIATSDDPRDGVVKGLTRIMEEGRQR